MNKLLFIHLSDLHYRKEWHEEVAVVLKGFYQDLGSQLTKYPQHIAYCLFSGDVVKEGDDKTSYDDFRTQFIEQFAQLGINSDRMIFLPGNHDVSRRIIRDQLIQHEGIVQNIQNEFDFNEFFSKEQTLFRDKFSNFCAFSTQTGSAPTSGAPLYAAKWKINDFVSVYGLNTALLSSGGLEKDGNSLRDHGRLGVSTRWLHKALQACDSRIRILALHHPLDWLSAWAQREVQVIEKTYFTISLSGHVHEQDLYHQMLHENSLIKCSAPPLFTRKTDALGYSIIRIDDFDTVEVTYRQWTKHHTFLKGVNFANNEDGSVLIRLCKDAEKPERSTQLDLVASHQEKRLKEALAFSSLPIRYVQPFVKTAPEFTKTYESETATDVDLQSFITSPHDAFICAPPEYGLTCLARNLEAEAWNKQKSFWIHIDALDLKPYKVERAIHDELSQVNLKTEDIRAIVVDSWQNSDKNSLKILERVIELLPNLPLIVFETVNLTAFYTPSSYLISGRGFNSYYLWPLTRTQIRQFVVKYNDVRHLGDEDVILSKVVSDLEVMNLPRTPLNCIQVIAASERRFEDSPVNRTEVINKVLRLLFDIDTLPTYQSRPDVKDCEYVLGQICEELLRNGAYSFTEDYFFSKAKAICKAHYIQLDVTLLFRILVENRIVVFTDNGFRFKYRMWVLYFAAHRMKHDQAFAEYILSDMRYAAIPEIIEFYTGLDRDKTDALSVLVRDVSSICSHVSQRIGLKRDIEPFDLLYWNPTSLQLEAMQKEVGDDVKASDLPDIVKDQYADQAYDWSRPHNQTIASLVSDYAVDRLIGAVRAGSRALRNSDYADPETKKKLLHEIMLSWEQVAMLIFFISPMLAAYRRAEFEGTVFSLVGSFSEDFRERFAEVLSAIPYNILLMFQEDLNSMKMGPLLLNQIRNEKVGVRRHLLVRLLILQRPLGWGQCVEEYIASVGKNSFYLRDTYDSLATEYRFGFLTSLNIREIKRLIKMTLAKHHLGKKHPSRTDLSKIPDDSLPPREIDPPTT